MRSMNVIKAAQIATVVLSTFIAGCAATYADTSVNHPANVDQAEAARTQAQLKAAHCAAASNDVRQAHQC